MQHFCLIPGERAAFDDDALSRKINFCGKTLEDVQQRGVVAGSLSAIGEQLQALEGTGVQRIMLQWLDLESLEVLAKAIL